MIDFILRIYDACGQERDLAAKIISNFLKVLERTDLGLAPKVTLNDVDAILKRTDANTHLVVSENYHDKLYHGIEYHTVENPFILHSVYALLFIAVENLDVNMVEILLGCGADPRVVLACNETLLHVVAKNGGDLQRRLAIARLLLRRLNKVDINAFEVDHETPLHFLIDGQDPNIEMVRLFVENGAGTNIADDAGDTPLAYAVRRGLSIEIVRFLS